MNGELADDGVEAFEIFAFAEAKDVVFAKSTAIERETVAKAAEIVKELHCLILWHGYPGLVAVLHE